MQPRLDTPCEPVISSSECHEALSLMEKMAGNMVTSGDLPEELVELLDRFSRHVHELLSTSGEGAGASGNTPNAFGGLIWLMPTFSREHVTREHVGAAILRLIEARANLAAYSESPSSGIEY